MRSLHLCTVAALAAALSFSSAAMAAPTAKDRAEAKALGAEGRKALKDKRWADAIAALKKAERLDPGPALGLDLAHAQIGAGKLVEASKTLASIAAGTETAPAARRARDAAKKGLADLKARIPTLKVKVSGAPVGKATTVVDGIEVDGSDEILVNPGDHTIGASADGFVGAEQDLRFAEGTHEQVSLKLVAKKVVGAEDEKKTGSRVPGAVVTAIGGAGLLVGGIFGGLALTSSKTAKAECNGNLCPSTAAADIARSKTYGNVSTGMLIAGGAVAVTGIALLIAAPGGGSAKPDDAGHASRGLRPSARLTPWFGPSGAGLGAVGSF